MMTPLQALEAWNRKHYSFTLKASGNTQPGDGPHVTLKGGGRTVTVSDYELVTGDEDDDTPLKWPTLDELVTEALRRWHADTSRKRYNLLYRIDHGNAPENHKPHGNMHMASFYATSEAEAKKMIDGVLKDSGVIYTLIQVWEMTEDWTH